MMLSRMGLGDASYPNTGRAISPAQFGAEYQAIATPNYPVADPSNPGQWGATVAVVTSLDAQRAYNRSLYDAGIQDPGDGHGNYWEPAYQSYVYSADVPSWALPFLPSQVAEPAQGATPQTPAAVVQQLNAMVNASNAAAAAPLIPAAPAVVIHSAVPGSPVANSPASSSVSESTPGPGLSSVPWWGWAIGGGLLLWLVMEKN